MYFQRVLKGISGLTRQDADTSFQQGLQCNWWLRVHHISPGEIVNKLTERNLDWHLNHYSDPDPLTGAPFSENTPFISVTAGVVERDAFLRRNFVFDPLLTALDFATRHFTTSGYIFHAYVFTLGRQSLELEEFAEEVRELNIYKDFLPYHREGEITAKIAIRGPQIEKWEEYDGPAVFNALRACAPPSPVRVQENPIYAPPERYCNIRGLVTD
ncbi:MAG: hypothetical protein ABUT39_04455 [Acidobacteriota bacterium]